MEATRRRLTGRLGAYSMLSRHDPTEMTAHAREVGDLHWRRLVDPSEMLAPDEIERRVREAKSEYFGGLAQLSAAKRSARARPIGAGVLGQPNRGAGWQSLR